MTLLIGFAAYAAISVPEALFCGRFIKVGKQS